MLHTFGSILLILFISLNGFSQSCVDLFQNSKRHLNTFEILMTPKKFTEDYFDQLRTDLTNSPDFAETYQILVLLADKSVSEISREHVDQILAFRSDLSFLRSSYELLSEKHKSSRSFDQFVKTFGKLKDSILINDRELTQEFAMAILEKFEPEKIKDMIKPVNTADKKSIYNYLKNKLSEITKINQKKMTTFNDIHDLRKALRNVLRYIEIQKAAVDIPEIKRKTLKKQIQYLKAINLQLGEICDFHSTLVLTGQQSKDEPLLLPEYLKTEISHFLNIVHLQKYKKNNDLENTYEN